MEEKEKAAYPGRDGLASPNPVRHEKCKRRLQKAVESSELHRSIDILIYGKIMRASINFTLLFRSLCKIHAGCYEEGWLVCNNA